MLKGGGAVKTPRNVSEIELPTINTSASKVQSSTQQSNSYTSNIVQIGKGNLRLQEIPQSVSVMTRQRLIDQNLQTLDHAMGQIPGVTILVSTQGSDYLIRGYNVDQFQFDGLVMNNTKIERLSNIYDTAMFDHIEVLKGPSGLLQGSGEPSGTINMVRKRALKNPKFQVALSGGSWDALRGEADITGAFDKEGNFRGRLVVVKDNRNSFIDEVFNNKSVLYGTLEYDFTPNTTLSIGGTYQGGSSVPNYGLPAVSNNGNLYDLPRSTFLGDTWNRNNEDAKRYFVDLEHHLSNGGEIRFASSFLDNKSKFKSSAYPNDYPVLTTGSILTGPEIVNETSRALSIDAYITTPFKLFNNSHNILVGINYSNEKGLFSASYSSSITKNIFNPAHNSPESNWDPLKSRSSTKSMQTGMYAQLRFKIIKNITLVAGGRLSWYENKTDKIKINAHITPYAGIIYDITNEYALYASYANVFVPQTDKTWDNKVIKPRTGNQYEIGAKASWFDGGLNASLALFLLDDENRAIEDIEHPKFSVAQGKLRNYGFEAEVSGNILSWWDIMAGYNFFEQKLIESRGTNQFRGAIPQHSFKLWSSHTIKDFKIGYGTVVSSDMYAQFETKRKLQDSYAIFSAMLGYKINKNFDLAFNIDNIFDHKYYARVTGFRSHNHYGEPRSFMLTVRGQY